MKQHSLLLVALYLLTFHVPVSPAKETGEDQVIREKLQQFEKQLEARQGPQALATFQ